MSSPVRICAFTDALLPPYDEGIRKVTQHVYAHLAKRPDTLLLATQGEEYAQVVPANKALMNLPIAQSIRGFRPDVIFYVPEAAMTLSSVLRARMLKLYGRGCPVALFSMQPRTYSGRSAGIVRRLRPGLVITQSSAEAQNVQRLGCKAVAIPAGVDLDRFAPVTGERKADLRSKYGVDGRGKVVLHVGHLKESRNVRIFERLQRAGETQCVLAGSTSTEQDRALAGRLREIGVIVLDTYQPNIEELYQLADLYVFPVRSENAAITFPLSVLEALACNVPVITTRFGGLVDALPETDGLRYVDSDEELISAVESFSPEHSYDVRSQVEQFSWDGMAESIVKELEALARPATGTL